MKIAVLLSGGVDSSVTLTKLVELGYTDITAYYLKIWLEDELSYLGACPWEEDLAFAQAVCDQLKVNLKIVNLQTEYFDRVVDYALAELRAGRTPSPDIFCNQRVKFGAFFDKVGDSFDFVATGHYASLYNEFSKTNDYGSPPRVQKNIPYPNEEYARLYRGIDPVKDQTYFLSHLSQAQLSKIIVPLGSMPKARVREYAASKNLATMKRPDSQGICFLGKIPYNEFVKHYLGVKTGPIVDLSSGTKMGEHQGFWFHTIGQRTGLGLSNGPWYVSAKDHTRNIVYVSKKETNPELDRKTFKVEEVHWLRGRAPNVSQLETWNTLDHETYDNDSDQVYEDAKQAGSEDGHAKKSALAASRLSRGLCAKLRHGPNTSPCTIEYMSDQDYTKLNVELANPDPGIAAGQFAVFYVDDEVVGSGRICELDPDAIKLYGQRFDQVEAQLRAAEVQKKREKEAKRARYFAK